MTELMAHDVCNASLPAAADANERHIALLQFGASLPVMFDQQAKGSIILTEVVIGECKVAVRSFFLLLEPYRAHAAAAADEYYLCIHADRAGNHVLYLHRRRWRCRRHDRAACTDVQRAAPSSRSCTAAAAQPCPACSPRAAGRCHRRALCTVCCDALFGPYLEINPLVVAKLGQMVCGAYI